MCDFPSWIENDDGRIWFLTDREANKLCYRNPWLSRDDTVGHSAVRLAYPEAEGVSEEGFPCHPKIAAAIRNGRMEALMRAGGYASVSVDKDGKLHREDGPAVVWNDGAEEWYKDGKLHREDGPAIVRIDGTKEWWCNGKLHREDGPAIVCTDGTKEWWRNGRLHREDGPAVMWSNGEKAWYEHGRLLREDGPRER